MDYIESDVQLAIQLQARFNEELRLQESTQDKQKVAPKDGSQKKKHRTSFHQEKLSIPLSDPSWELIDPSPDIHSLFQIFNGQFFWGSLDAVVVQWSPRLTLCAGICCYEGRAGMCLVKLSSPLLKFRPRKDLIDTLLHEMIHAYLFVTHNNRDRDGHGPNFHEHMYRINRIAGTKITVYHSFHDEVAVYKQHIWKCNGPCQHSRPYYGLIKRSMNRAPNKHDPWWSEHQSRCGGSFLKIKEPENYGVKKRKAVDQSKTSSPKEDIRKFLKKGDHKSEETTSSRVGSVNNPGGATVSSVSVAGASGANVHKIKTAKGSGIVAKPRNGTKKPRTAAAVDKGSKTSSSTTVTGSKDRKAAAPAGDSSSKCSNNIGSNSVLPAVGSGRTSSEETTNKIPLATTFKSSEEMTNFVAFSGTGHVLNNGPKNHSESIKKEVPMTYTKSKASSSNLDDSVIFIDVEDDIDCRVVEPPKKPLGSGSSYDEPLFSCPICLKKFSSFEINRHADSHF